jgi:hypothetical protein
MDLNEPQNLAKPSGRDRPFNRILIQFEVLFQHKTIDVLEVVQSIPIAMSIQVGRPAAGTSPNY